MAYFSKLKHLIYNPVTLYEIWHRVCFENSLERYYVALFSTKASGQCFFYLESPPGGCMKEILQKITNEAPRWPIFTRNKLTQWIIPSSLLASIIRKGLETEDKLGHSVLLLPFYKIKAKTFRQIWHICPIYGFVSYLSPLRMVRKTKGNVSDWRKNRYWTLEIKKDKKNVVSNSLFFIYAICMASSKDKNQKVLKKIDH